MKKVLAESIRELGIEERNFLKGKQSSEKNNGFAPITNKITNKIPQSARDGVYKAFTTGFSAILNNGNAIIEVTYNKKGMIKQNKQKEEMIKSEINDHSLSELHKGTTKNNLTNIGISALEGVGLGAFGIGIPDIPIFIGVILKEIYQISLNYGFNYEKEEEKIFILNIIQGALSEGKEIIEINRKIDEIGIDIDSNRNISYSIKDEMRKTSSLMADKLLLSKFIQSMFIVGAIGGMNNVVVLGTIARYATIKYKKRKYRILVEMDEKASAEQYILNIPKFAEKTGLDNLKAILELMGNPQKELKVIHVAGTNGKGSTCKYMQSILKKSGYKAGMFSSPHLVKINERMRINDTIINDGEFVAVYKYLRKIIDNNTEICTHPSFFEFLFLMSVKWFSEKKVDLVIYEVGLGGRFDATNILTPIVSVITSIGMDHMEYLGNTLEEIAREKAGIIKENIPVIYFKRDKRAADEIERIAMEKRATVYAVENTDYLINEISDKTIDFSLNSSYYKKCNYSIQKTGLYQIENAILAIIALSQCKDIYIEDKAIKEGLMEMKWAGRMEEIDKGVFIDGAHNEEAIKVLNKTIKELYNDHNKVLLFAVAKDKNYSDMIKDLCDGIEFKNIIVTAIECDRKTDIDNLVEIFAQYSNAEITSEESISEAYNIARMYKEAEDYLFCTGSLYLAGSIIKRNMSKD